MKKTISIHLMGTNFLVEEDAYELVRDYLERLQNSLKNSSDQKEICEDVELRIAELATAIIKDKKEIVSYEEMKQILETLGQPEDFVEEDQEFSKESKYSEPSIKKEKRLFRDKENGVFGGVCAGLAAYFNIDVVVFRIIFAILGFAGGFIIPIYIILMVVIPKAKTNIDRLQMQGRPINLENLKEEFEDAAQRMKSTSKKFESEISDKNSPTRQRISHLARTISKLMGVFLLIIGSLGLVGILSIAFIDLQFFSFTDVDSQLNYSEISKLIMVDQNNANFLWLGGLLTGISVSIFTVLSGAALIFSLKSKWLKRSFLLLTLTGLVGVILGIYQGVRLGSDYAIPGEYELSVGQISDSILKIKVLPSFRLNHVDSPNKGFDGDFFETSGNKIVHSGIDINYTLSTDSSFHVYAEYSARANGKRKAIERSKNIVHEIQISKNELVISPYFKFPLTDKVRNQSVTLTIEIPVGKKIQFGEFSISSANAKESGYIDRDGKYEHFNGDSHFWNRW